MLVLFAAFQFVGNAAVVEVPRELKFSDALLPALIEICPHPVVAKVIKAAQIARAWNLKQDFATPFRP